MSFTERNIRDRAQKEMQRSINRFKTKNQVLNDSASNFNKNIKYDVFLSHSSKDSELVLGVKVTLEDLGYSVYVDWIDDAQLDCSKVDKNTAQLLRERMKASNSLFYITTDNSETSKWMPWECGYFDGIKEKVAILPIQKYSFSQEYNGQEYLSLYPYCIKGNDTNKRERLWIHNDNKYYLVFEKWLETKRDNIQWQKIG